MAALSRYRNGLEAAYPLGKRPKIRQPIGTRSWFVISLENLSTCPAFLDSALVVHLWMFSNARKIDGECKPSTRWSIVPYLFVHCQGIRLKFNDIRATSVKQHRHGRSLSRLKGIVTAVIRTWKEDSMNAKTVIRSNQVGCSLLMLGQSLWDLDIDCPISFLRRQMVQVRSWIFLCQLEISFKTMPIWNKSCQSNQSSSIDAYLPYQRSRYSLNCLILGQSFVPNQQSPYTAKSRYYIEQADRTHRKSEMFVYQTSDHPKVSVLGHCHLKAIGGDCLWTRLRFFVLHRVLSLDHGQIAVRCAFFRSKKSARTHALRWEGHANRAEAVLAVSR